MIAAIYARKSTSQEKATEEARSTSRQVALARAFAERQGWTVSAEHLFVEAISGGEIKKRAGLQALLVAAKTTPRPFDVIVMMAQSRLARRMRYAVDILHDLADCNVRVFFYQTGQECRLDTATDRFMGAVTGFSDESYRESIRLTTRETLRRKVERGEVGGGRVYGYTNIGQPGSRRREINPTEAAVVRRIFELTVKGYGLLKIAKLLNAEGVPSPRGDGWATTAIREMLRRDLYRGRIVYGKTQWIDKGETKGRLRITDPAQWITLDAPGLRIVPDELWNAAHARIERTRQTHSGRRQPNGRLHGRAESALVSRHLLSGFLRCGVCGGNMFVCPRAGKRGKAQIYYVCTTHHKRGSTRCTNRHGVPYVEITEAVIDHFSPKFLTPEVMKKFLEDDAAANAPDALKAESESLSADIRRLDADIQRLVEAVASGAGSIPALVEAMKKKQLARDNAAARLTQIVERAAEREPRPPSTSTKSTGER